MKAESVFALDLRTDIALSALALGVFGSSLFIETPPGQIPDSLNRSDVNPFDRFFMFTRLNAPIRYASSATMVGMAAFLPAIPILYSFDTHFNMNTILTYGVMYSQATLLAYGTRILLRNNLTRFRPYDHDGSLLEPNARHDSFPSGHTTVAFMSASFFSTAFSLEHPNSVWRLPAIIGSHALAAGVGAMRVVSGMHFVTDVIAGAGLGSLVGWLMPHLHRWTQNSNFEIIAGNGLLLSFRYQNRQGERIAVNGPFPHDKKIENISFD